ncbi:hypothetical protein [Christiangramia sp. SM2212]|uniref:Uncharacterized protein n=1 Tax=Christiangramia sediminicola TaxID=3073267 RepID=A0ABU1EL47_9FLAO|nr:hypothetical protein [Christiangramia sp. SM2212]MDR5589086.1 hypothetical protein [Christiangramia sp. SM2212]
MTEELKVLEFDKKKELVECVNENREKLEIVSITSTQVGTYFRHFLWYYTK